MARLLNLWALNQRIGSLPTIANSRGFVFCDFRGDMLSLIATAYVKPSLLPLCKFQQPMLLRALFACVVLNIC
ncbi:hypothetical protein RchiOBHm_Chr4g0434551 [Rosa chinensis]|uniref:Uncharacterized protein n=1 Tax=Rosa chinensis TaxID=74649 RepID=A0A2P6R1J1_ROSCH|nr:hypothetical protein RchiOBHm_Chr4g0434551 [Rosa chinensis]